MRDEQLLRYSRHLMLPDFDVAGQQKLLEAKVLVMGVGGLGSAIIQYLAAAGVGELVLVDFDQVEVSNLQRQVIHSENTVGQMKTESARQFVAALNPDVQVRCINHIPEDHELSALVQEVDLVIDGTDNYDARARTNRFCVQHQTPLVSGAAIGFEGQLTVFDARNPENPCYHCLYPDGAAQNLRCAENGVLGPVVGMVGAAQAVEAIKVLSGVGSSLVGRLQLLDAKHMQWREMKYRKDPDCMVCGNQS